MTELQKKLNRWHEEAMDLAEMAISAKRRNELMAYYRLIQRALNYEKAAARLLKVNRDIEPTRSVLYQGAVHFALNLDRFDEASLLIHEALDGKPPIEILEDLEDQLELISKKKDFNETLSSLVQSFLKREKDPGPEKIKLALDASITAINHYYSKEDVPVLLNRAALQVHLETKHGVANPEFQIFEATPPVTNWLATRETSMDWIFWDAYKKLLDHKGIAAGTIERLSKLTDGILNRIGDPKQPGIWDKRGMVVGDVQSGKTSNYLGLINKAADAGFRIIIILTGLYENLREQTQRRVDEGFSGFNSQVGHRDRIGVGEFRIDMPVHPITHAGYDGDLNIRSIKNLPLNTNDYYAVVIKKNTKVLEHLLRWLHGRGEKDGDYKIIRNTPVLVIDDEADYASINVDKDFVSRTNASIRALLALFEQSAFIGYTATPFANVFISDHNETVGKDITIGGKKFRLGIELFPKDFIINIPPPSNYIGYKKIFDTTPPPDEDTSATDNGLPIVEQVEDYEASIPKKHKKDDQQPASVPPSLMEAMQCFVIVCAIRMARGQENQHNSMLVHVSWYKKWINHIAELVNKYLDDLKDGIRYDQTGPVVTMLKDLWEKKFKGHTADISLLLGYEDPMLIEHEWDEIQPFLTVAAEKIIVRAVHGPEKNKHELSGPLNYHDYPEGMSVIAVGGNKLSRGLTLEGLSISYFLRATRFYDTLLQMGRWFGYRPGYADLCRLYTTSELVLWYQIIGAATEDLKDQFDMMNLIDRNPENFGLKVKLSPGMLYISAAAKIKGAITLDLSYSGQLLETYIISKSQNILSNNLETAKLFVKQLGEPVGTIRQNQRYIWENVPFNLIGSFLEHYKTEQLSLSPQYLRTYLEMQVPQGDLNSWTVVVINNSRANHTYTIETLDVGLTVRGEETKEPLNIPDPNTYYIKNSRIISPPHEYLDMDEQDKRLVNAKNDTKADPKINRKSDEPAGKYVRKHRGRQNALLLLYLLDPEQSFGGKKDLPAIGYAISLPAIDRDRTYSYAVNKLFWEEQFGYTADAEEDPENSEEV
jgi:hypothetical protein